MTTMVPINVFAFTVDELKTICDIGDVRPQFIIDLCPGQSGFYKMDLVALVEATTIPASTWAKWKAKLCPFIWFRYRSGLPD